MASPPCRAARPSFPVVREASRHTSVREHVAAKLLQTASKTGSTVLLRVAQSVKLDAFVKAHALGDKGGRGGAGLLL